MNFQKTKILFFILSLGIFEISHSQTINTSSPTEEFYIECEGEAYNKDNPNKKEKIKYSFKIENHKNHKKLSFFNTQEKIYMNYCIQDECKVEIDQNYIIVDQNIYESTSTDKKNIIINDYIKINRRTGEIIQKLIDFTGFNRDLVEASTTPFFQGLCKKSEKIKDIERKF